MKRKYIECFDGLWKGWTLENSFLPFIYYIDSANRFRSLTMIKRKNLKTRIEKIIKNRERRLGN